MSKVTQQDKKRLSMDVSSAIHKLLKTMAINYNCTITTYVLKAIEDKLKQEEQYR
jgi:hypothetical protein